MAIDFPISPSINDTHTNGNDVWVCTDITPSIWEKQTLIIPMKVVSDTAPSNPISGQEWTDTTNGKDYTWYEDATSGQWISESSIVNQASNIIVRGGVVGYEKDESFLVQSSSTIIPWDDTIPQITEGEQIHSISYTPKYANSILVIKAHGNSNTTTTNITTILTLFVDGNANAIKSSRFSDITEQTEKSTQQVSLDHTYICTSTDTLDFTLRYGINSAGTIYTNATTLGDRRLGGTSSTFLEVTEINIDAGNANVYESGEVLQVVHHQLKQTDPTLVVGYNIINKIITPKSNNSKLIVHTGLTLYADQDGSNLTCKLDIDGVDSGLGEMMRGYVYIGRNVFSIASEVFIENTTTTSKDISLYAHSVINSPRLISNDGYVFMKITEVQN